MAEFTLITNVEIGRKVEEVFKSKVITHDWSIKLRSVKYDMEYSIIKIESIEENKTIQPKDIFFLGLYTATTKL